MLRAVTVALVGMLALASQVHGQGTGLLVERVEEGGAAAEAGVRVGDVVLSWQGERSSPGSSTAVVRQLDSPFDLRSAELEQVGCGAGTLEVEREGRRLRLAVAAAPWRLEVAPRLDGAAIAGYRRAVQAPAPGELDAVVWLGRLADRERARGASARAAWWLSRAAGIANDQGRALDAGALFAQAAALVSDLPPVAARVAEVAGEASAARRQSEAAESSARRALELRSAWSGETVAAAESFNRLGEGATVRGDLAGAQGAFLRAYSITRRRAPDSLQAAASIAGVGMVLLKRGDLASAERCFRAALPMRERLAPESPAVASTLTTLGIVAWNRGDLASAEALYLRALAILERTVPGRMEVALVLNNLGNTAWRRGDLEAAEGYLERALAIKEALAPGSLTVGASLNGLGAIALDRGDLAMADSFFRRALAIKERLAPGTVDLALTLSNVGNVAMVRGDLAAAERFQLRALEIRERQAPGSLDYATSLCNLAQVASARRDLERAEELYRLALSTAERVAPDGPDVANALNSLGAIAATRGDLVTAESSFARALAVNQRLAPDSPAVAMCLGNLGAAEQGLGRLDASERHLLLALQMSQKLTPGTLHVAEALANLGLLEQARGKTAAAERYLQAALALRQELVPDTSLVAETLHVLGTLYRDSNRSEEALRYYARAVDTLEVQKSRLGGSYQVRIGFTESYLELYLDYLDLLVELGRPAEAFGVLERSRARAFAAMLAERDLVFSADLPDELDRERRRAAAAYDRTLERVAAIGANRPEDGAELRRQLEEAGRVRDEVLQRVRAAAPRLAALVDPQPVDLDATRALLEPGTLLLAYSLGSRRSYLFAVGPEADALAVYRLDTEEESVRDAVERLRGMLARGSEEAGRRGLAAWSSQLTRTLLAPARVEIGRARRLVIVPDGPLHLLPFAALLDPGSAGGAHFLVEGRPVSVVASATVLGQLRAERRKGKGARVVVFADPSRENGDLGTGSGALSRALAGGAALQPLPGSRGEVEALQRLYRDAATVWVGEEASEERAKALDRNVSVIHFACHGIVDEELPLDSGLVLAASGQEGEADNGLLQAWEIFERVRVDADLVTLSACDTGLGKVVAGEGLIGLTRAFQYAGARTVLGSLWSVADTSTAELMKRFYRHLRTGVAKDEALRAAMLELITGPVEIVDGEETTLRDLSHPFHWAGFEVVGDYR